MSADLADFSATIERLRHQHARPDLARLIEASAPGASKSERFLIKMEIKRLAQPTTRAMDFRKLLKEHCQAVSLAGITHYLDKFAEEDFKQDLARYQGRYCVGVFEHVTDKVRSRSREEMAVLQAQKLPSPVFFDFHDIRQRREERIYFSTRVEVFDHFPDAPSDEGGQHDVIEAITTDISQHGLTLKIPVRDYSAVARKFVRFVALEKEYVYDEPLYVSYRRVKSDIRDDYAYLTLMLDKEQPAAVIAACQELIRRCIFNYKGRNRVDVDNTLSSVKTKLVEQYLMGRVTGLPVFMFAKDGIWCPAAAFSSKDNQVLIDFLRYPSSATALTELLTQSPVKEMLQDNEEGQLDVFVLRFKSKHQGLGFAVIDLQQVRKSSDIAQLLRKAQSQGLVRLLRLTSCPLDPLHTAHIPSSLPDGIGEAFANLNRPPGEKLLAEVEKLQRLCVITDQSSSIELLNLLGHADPNSAPVNINPFRLQQREETGDLFWYALNEPDERLEDRFDIVMKVILSSARMSAGGPVEAKTENVSSRGLLLRVKKSLPLVSGDEVSLDIQLPTKDKRILPEQKYQVVSNSEHGLHLTVKGDIKHHEARQQLRGLINANLGVISRADNAEPVYGYSRALRHIFAAHLLNIGGLTVKQGKQHYVYALSANEHSHLSGLLTDGSYRESLQNLCKDPHFLTIVLDLVRKLTRQDHFQICHLLLVARSNKDGDGKTWLIKHLEAESSGQETQALLTNLSLLGEPVLLRLNILRPAHLYDKYLRDEKRYLAKFAKSKLAECASLTEQVSAILDMQDVSSLLPLVPPSNPQP